MLQPIEKKISLPPRPVSGSPNSLEAQIGRTPLLDLRKIAATYRLPESVQLLAKAEWFNPSGSVKDRAALNIILTAEAQGLLRPGMTLLDSTSGNMGIAYAMIAAARGYLVKLTIPENASPERVAVLKAYGVELVFTDPVEGSDGALLVARGLAETAGDNVYFANQYNNPANWQAHYYTTANEIWEQTGGQLTHFAAGTGTSGTLMGATRRLKELNPTIQSVAVQPDSPFNGLEGLKHMATSINPGIYDAAVADRQLTVRTEAAYQMARDMARTEGLFVGISAAAAVVAAIEIALDLTSGMIVTLLPDSGLKYLSERFWSDKQPEDSPAPSKER